jgi:iron complex outermembrane receptor protein
MLKSLIVKFSLAAFTCSVSLAAFAFADSPRQIDVPAGDLITALESMARQADVELAFQPEQLKGLRTKGVTGLLTTRDAVRKLLEGTRLQLRTDELTGAMMIAAPVPAAAPPVKTTTPEAMSAPRAFWDRFRLAQAQTSPESTGKPTEPQGEMLQEIVVTATKRAERIVEVPQSVSVLRSEDLARIGATQFRDFASTVPGLSFATSGAGYTQISLRGVTAGIDIGQTVGIYVDEVPYGSSSAFGGAAQHTLDIGLFDVDRIEVLRGPQGTLYGASTMGGLIKYVTPTPDSTKFGINARTGVSSTRDGGVGYLGSAALNAPLVADRAALRVGGFYSHDGGFIDNVARGEADVNSSNFYGGRLDLLLTPADTVTLRLTGFLQNINRGGESTTDYDFSGSPLDDRLDQRRLFAEPFGQRFRSVSGTASFELEGATLTSISSYQTTELEYVQDLSPLYVPLLEFFGPFSAVGARADVSMDKFTQELRLASGGERTLQWLVGAFYTREKSAFAQEFVLRDLAGQPVLNNLYTNSLPTRFEEYAAFGDLTWYLTPAFDVTAGTRYARNDQSFTQIGSGFLGLSAPTSDASEKVFTYLANARYRFSERTTGYLRYATGYRPGGPNVVNVDPGTGELIGSPTFDADRLKSYEVGFRTGTVDRRFGIDVAAYWIDWDDIHVSVVRGGFSAIDNARGGAGILGAELALSAQPTRALSVTGAFAWQDARMSRAEPALGAAEDERLPNVPRFTATLNVDYELAYSGIQPKIGATLRHIGDRMASFDGSQGYVQYPLGDYTSVDLRAGFSIASVDVQLYVHNLFDENGQLSAYNWRGSAQPAILQPQTLGLSLATRF